MNKLLLSLSFFLSFMMVVFGQTKVHGVVKNGSTEKEVYNLNVKLEGLYEEMVTTDRIGYFQFMNVPNGSYTLRVNGPNYDPYLIEFTLSLIHI